MADGPPKRRQGKAPSDQRRLRAGVPAVASSTKIPGSGLSGGAGSRACLSGQPAVRVFTTSCSRRLAGVGDPHRYRDGLIATPDRERDLVAYADLLDLIG